jgi:hypothetical protein
MTDVWIGLPEKSASEPTPTESCAGKTDMPPKLDLQHELDRKREKTPITSDAPRHARKLRIAATVVALLAVLGIGWGAGLKTHELVSVVHVSSWLQQTAGALLSSLDTQRQAIIATIEGLARTSAPQATISSVPNETKNTEATERSANELGIKMDLLRLSSATMISELGRGFERLNGSVERSQRELAAKLDQLQGRLERLEHQTSSTSRTSHAPVEQPTAAKNVPLPVQPSTAPIPVEASKPTTALTETKRIENWEVMEVVDGTAVLAGPRGIIEVSSGDVVPGVGRVASIFRRGGRWVVATTKGVITSR